MGEHSRQGGGTQQGRRGNQNRGPEWSGWESVRMGGSDNKGDGLASQPRRTPAQPASGGGCLPQPRWAVCATRVGAHQGQTSREGEKDIWWTVGTMRGGTGHLGLTHTETQRGKSWAACGHVDRGAWTANLVKGPRQQPAQPQYAHYGAPPTRKRHTMPHPAQPRWTNKQHQQEHWPQRPTESSNPTQHAKGRTASSRKETTIRRNVIQVGGRGLSRDWYITCSCSFSP